MYVVFLRILNRTLSWCNSMDAGHFRYRQSVLWIVAPVCPNSVVPGGVSVTFKKLEAHHPARLRHSVSMGAKQHSKKLFLPRERLHQGGRKLRASARRAHDDVGRPGPARRFRPPWPSRPPQLKLDGLVMFLRRLECPSKPGWRFQVCTFLPRRGSPGRPRSRRQIWPRQN